MNAKAISSVGSDMPSEASIPPMAPFESRLLSRLDEPLAAGFYELCNASQIRRLGRALNRYAESVGFMPASTGDLYPAGALNPWNLNGSAVGHHYSSGLSVNGSLLRDKIGSRLTDERERNVASGIAADLENLCVNPMSNRFCVGGRGYTHSILNFCRILADGLPSYGRRIERGLAQADDPDKRDFHLACGEAFGAVMTLLAKSVAACVPGPLKAVLQAAAERAPETFHEAIALINFMYYIDGCDSIGALDRYLAPFYFRDLAAGSVTPQQAEGWRADAGNRPHRPHRRLHRILQPTRQTLARGSRQANGIL